MVVYFPLFPFPLVFFPGVPAQRFFLTYCKDAQGPIIMHHLLQDFLKQEFIFPTSFVNFQSSFTCKTCEKAYGRGEIPLMASCHLQPPPPCPAPRPSATTVERKSSIAQHILVVYGASRTFKPLQEKYLSKFMPPVSYREGDLCAHQIIETDIYNFECIFIKAISINIYNFKLILYQEKRQILRVIEFPFFMLSSYCSFLLGLS